MTGFHPNPPQMIFVYFLIVSHFDALVVRFNKCSRLQEFETKGGTWSSRVVCGARIRDLAARAAGRGSWDRHTDKHGGPGGSLASSQPSIQTLPTTASVSQLEHLRVSRWKNKSERISKRAVQEGSKRGALRLCHREPQSPAWAQLYCCLCSSLTSARGLELSAQTWEHWGSWLAFDETLPVQPAQVPPAVSPALCLS